MYTLGKNQRYHYKRISFSNEFQLFDKNEVDQKIADSKTAKPHDPM